jgi:hypothetical protein
LTGGVSTLLEWDSKIPEFPVLQAEVLKARGYMHGAGDLDPRRVPHVCAATDAGIDSISNPLHFVRPRIVD